MPVESCSVEGKSGYRWGASGKCYTYVTGDDKAANEAKRKAHVQGYAMNVNKEGGAGQAVWISALLDKLCCFLGQPVIKLKKIEIEAAGDVDILGTTINDDGQPYDFFVSGPFDIEPQLMPATVDDSTMLYPFGTEFAPPVPDASEYGSADDAWKWASSQVPVLAQPRLNGFNGIIEKKGGKAKLWYTGERGVDQLSKFVALKDFILKTEGDYVAEVNVGLESDGVRLPQDKQMELQKRSPKLGPQDKLAVTFSDLVYKDEDLHQKDAAIRYEMLQKIFKDQLSAEPCFKLMPVKKAADQAELGNAVAWGRDFSGSSGVVLKTSASPYALVGKSSLLGYVAKSDPPKVMGIYKADDAQRIVYAVVLRPNFSDAQGDTMLPADVEKTAHDYLENSRILKFRHGKDSKYGDKVIDAKVLESYIAPADFPLGTGQVKKGDWVMAVRIDDQGLWDDVQSGKLNAFSVGGKGTRQELS